MSLKKYIFLLNAILVLVFIIPAILAPVLAPYNPYEINLSQQLLPPSSSHILGQDQNGSDIFSRLLYGARISLYVGLSVVTISMIIGVSAGLISGFYGGWVDVIFMRIVDILLAFPGLLLAIGLVAVLGPDVSNVVWALSLLGWVSYARLVRGQTLQIKEEEYILAAKTSGIKNRVIMFKHIFPNLLAPLLVQATFNLAGVIISESSLSFLGLGVPVGTPSWGAMLAEGKNVLIEAPFVSIFPGIAIMVVVLIFNLLGDALRDYYE